MALKLTCERRRSTSVLIEEIQMVDTTTTAVSVLRELVAFDTTSRNSNVPIILWIERYLAQHGVQAHRCDHVADEKVNLYAIIGPNDRPGIILSGHTDTVPVDGQDWSHDPYALHEENGRLFGRGTADMKGFLACVLASVPEFVKRRLDMPIVLVFSCDEEVGCRGVVPLIRRFATWPIAPVLAIVGEPTRMAVVKAHKGNITFETEVFGVEAHSSTPSDGVNAIYYAAQIVIELERIGVELQRTQDREFIPPYSTLHVGVINGGTVKNIVPGRCRIVWEIRSLPNSDLSAVIEKFKTFCEHLEDKMKRKHRSASIVTRLTNSVPPLMGDEERLPEVLAMQLAMSNSVLTASYTTEAGHFRSIGTPTIVCGPGDITQAHKPDEFIDRSELEKCVKFLSRLGQYCEGRSRLTL